MVVEVSKELRESIVGINVGRIMSGEDRKIGVRRLKRCSKCVCMVHVCAYLDKWKSLRGLIPFGFIPYLTYADKSDVRMKHVNITLSF